MASRRVVALSLLADVVIVVAFTTIGRATHDEALGFVGVARTTWPFLAGLVIAWLASLAWRGPSRPVRTGVPVWLITLIAGMLLRVASGQGTAVAFIVVAAAFLLLTLVGWRTVTAIVVRRSSVRL